jgi:hypothetical protein
VWIAALWAVVVSAGLAVGWPQSKGPDPAGSDPDLKAARAWALRYSQTLPDFVCTEFVRRYQNWTGTDFKVDTLTFRISFNQQREAYGLVARNQNPSHQSVESLNGSTTKGEFGSALRLIFDRESAAVFEPQKPQRLQRRILAVYAYAVRQENSHYTLEYGFSRILTAYHGRVYIDPSTGRVLRLTTEVDPPPNFPIRETSTTIDYGFRAIGVEEYLLPVHAEVRTFELPSEDELKHLSRSYRDLARRGIRYHNIVEFRDYRKFSTDSTVSFH